MTVPPLPLISSRLSFPGSARRDVGRVFAVLAWWQSWVLFEFLPSVYMGQNFPIEGWSPDGC